MGYIYCIGAYLRQSRRDTAPFSPFPPVLHRFDLFVLPSGKSQTWLGQCLALRPGNAETSDPGKPEPQQSAQQGRNGQREETLRQQPRSQPKRIGLAAVPIMSASCPFLAEYLVSTT
mmetsp:Transcript_11510/g.33905  ORF Transcript_11510/g.33905 Transcript_11510/m.33905 type:complete len:117 (-) Transcript_11510:108-458(-)